MQYKKINKTAIIIFLSLTFGMTIGVLIVARLSGFTLNGISTVISQLVVAGAMFIPALSAVVTQKFYLKKPLKELGFKFGPWSMYVKTYLVIVLTFCINYAFTWLFILKPDFTLRSFLEQFNMVATPLPVSASLMITILTFVTFVTAPLLNMIPSLGEEIGWRGFLLPSLEPLGKINAIVVSGVIWALWHTPMILIIGFLYGKEIWPGVLLHFLMITGLGIWMGYIWFRTRSTILAAFMHATFNANAYGVWAVLFVSKSKLIVGAAGVVGTTIFVILGLVTLYITRNWISRNIIEKIEGTLE